MNRPIQVVPLAADYSDEPYRIDWINVLILIPIPAAWLGFLAFLIVKAARML